jgi:tRNA G18 (ribose-2'-O)-methylase SpoU
LQIHPITALDRPELAPYATLRQSREHRREGFFVAEGDKVVRRLLASHFGVVSVLLPARRLAEFEPLIRARPEDVAVYVMEIAELEKLTGFPFFQGVLAVGKIPRLHTLDSILAETRPPRFFVAIDGLTNSENVGVIVRNCAAFGAQALIVDDSSASPFLRRSVRNSMGTIFKLPIVETASLVGALQRLRGEGMRVIAAHPQPEHRAIGAADFRRDCCVVFGSEGPGLSSAVLAACDESVSIPMEAEVDSLNVGSAAAVFLYEAAKQRGEASKPPHRLLE